MSKPVTVVALDLGNTTGFARSDGRRGILNLALLINEEPGARWPRVRGELRAVMAGVTWVAYERIVNAGGMLSKSNLYGLECQVVEIAAELGIETATVAPSSLKKFATGRGNAKKDEMRAAASTRWPGFTFRTHDEIDALWILEWSLGEIGRRVGAALPRARRRTT